MSFAGWNSTGPRPVRPGLVVLRAAQAARHLSLLSVAEVLHTISLPVLVRPRAPAGLQNAPGVTPVRIDGAVVWGALVVRVAVGFGRGFVVVFDGVGFGRGLVVVFDGVGFGLAEAGVGEAGAVAPMIALALAVGMSSSRAEPIPIIVNSKAKRPAYPPRVFLFSRARAATWAGMSRGGSRRFGFFTGRVCRAKASAPTGRCGRAYSSLRSAIGLWHRDYRAGNAAHPEETTAADTGRPRRPRRPASSVRGRARAGPGCRTAPKYSNPLQRPSPRSTDRGS